MITYASLKKAGLLAVIILTAYGCSGGEEKKQKKADENHAVSLGEQNLQDAEALAGKKKPLAKAFCVVHAKNGSEVVGAITFTQVKDGVRIIADIGGLTPGKHGFHIHEYGDCSAQDAGSAGAHYNPTNKKHGGPDSPERHVGDLGNLDADEAGFAHYDRIDHVISLNGPQSIVGKSVVIHADEDDFISQPAGNSGKRIACGVIVETKM